MKDVEFALEKLRIDDPQGFFNIVYSNRLLSPIFIKLKLGSLRDFKEYLISQVKEYYPLVCMETDIRDCDVYEILEELAFISANFERGVELDQLVRYARVCFDNKSDFSSLIRR